MKFSCRKEVLVFVAGGHNETKKRRLLKLIKQQLFALSATRSIGFCIKLPVPVVTMSSAAFRVALCHRGQRGSRVGDAQPPIEETSVSRL